MRQNEIRIEPVRVGDLEFEALVALGHVTDLGGENSRIPGEPFINQVGDLVRCHAQLRHGHRVRKTEHLRLLGDIHHAKAHLGVAVGFLDDRSDHHGLGAFALPVTIVDVGGLGWKGTHAADRRRA
jgi:hypothetical protein